MSCNVLFSSDLIILVLPIYYSHHSVVNPYLLIQHFTRTPKRVDNILVPSKLSYVPPFCKKIIFNVFSNENFQGEISTVLNCGVTPDRIIYAHTCKQLSYIKYARTQGLDLMTVDNVEELYKIKEVFSKARYIFQKLNRIIFIVV